VDKQVRKASFDFQALLACARGEMFGPGNAKLPLPPMLMFDRITSICDVGGMFGKGEIHADLEIKPISGSSNVTSKTIPLCRVVLVSTPCGSSWVSSWAGLGALAKAAHSAWVK
jgi:hypothetical protein